ncbi:hypothetical protein Goarm_002998 [Gossypium armourianum]|uniref:Uncharacterized protein n=1 Tax=Gossypium armourianum TaxID=34283 RepID=A0A7J9K1W3_9ROSI|nr:hypothetical protein [Gossypium armourianum]
MACGTRRTFITELAPPYVRIRRSKYIRDNSAITIWVIWWSRKQLVHENVTQTSLGVVIWMKALDLTIASTSESTILSRLRWVPPCDLFVLVNFDACYKQQTSSSVSDIIVRDYAGLVLG